MLALRKKFWVPRSRQRTRQVIRACPRCKTFNVQPYSQEHAPLPEERVTGPPFSHVGVDLGGPVYIKDDQRVSKTYFAIFTCTSVRAVHLELVRGLSTADFMQAYARFAARRGRPRTVFSDNGTNFHGAACTPACELRDQMDVQRAKSPLVGRLLGAPDSNY